MRNPHGLGLLCVKRLSRQAGPIKEEWREKPSGVHGRGKAAKRPK